MERLNRKFESSRSFVPRPEILNGANAKIGIIAYGTSHWGIIESRDQLRSEYAIETDYLRLRAYPFTREVHEFIEQHERVYVVEQNRDAQMLSLLKLDLKPELTRVCAPSAISTDLRSMRAPSTTDSAPWRASKWRLRRPQNQKLRNRKSTASASASSITRAERPRSALVAATMLFPSALSKPCMTWASSPSTSP